MSSEFFFRLSIEAKGRHTRFHELNTKRGFNKVLPLNVFEDASKGYLINDCGVFGAEVFVLPTPSITAECASVIPHDTRDANFAWEIRIFS